MLKITFGCPSKAFYKLFFFSFYWIYCILQNNFILAPGVPRHKCWLGKGIAFDSCRQPALAMPTSCSSTALSLTSHSPSYWEEGPHVTDGDAELREAPTGSCGRVTRRNRVMASCPWPCHGVGRGPLSPRCLLFSLPGCVGWARSVPELTQVCARGCRTS